MPGRLGTLPTARAVRADLNHSHTNSRNRSDTNSPVRLRWAGSICLAWTTREALAISGRRGFSIASIAGRRFPGFPAVLPEDIHIRGNNRSVGINQSM
jgi:hypothetical protein